MGCIDNALDDLEAFVVNMESYLKEKNKELDGVESLYSQAKIKLERGIIKLLNF